MENGLHDGLAAPAKIGRARRIDDAQARLYRIRQADLPEASLRLEGLRIVVDCANGAAYKVAPGRAVGNWGQTFSASASSRTA